MPIFDALGPLAPFVRALALTAAAILWTLVLARAVGLRAFSKATAFDFAATIATGSLIAQAGTRSNWTDFGQVMAAIGAIFLVQFALARGRLRSQRFANLVDNRPLLLVNDGKLIQAALRQARVTEATIREKIRGANATGLGDIAAMVLETTGDITVVRRQSFDPALLEGVRHVA